MPVVPLPATGATGPAYDLVLLAHVLAAAVGLGAVVVAGASAAALGRSARSGSPVSEALRRYYRPGVNWAGRVLVLVPVLGAALVAMSGGQFSYRDGWIVAGLVAWLVVTGVAESLLWPAERGLQEAVVGTPPDDLADRCRRVAALAGVLAVLLVATAVVMVAQP